jgi:hypothetical protein
VSEAGGEGREGQVRQGLEYDRGALGKSRRASGGAVDLFLAEKVDAERHEEDAGLNGCVLFHRAKGIGRKRAP